MAVMAVIIILSVQAVVSLSVLVYYERFHRDEADWWKTRLAPLLSFFSQAFVVYLLFTNITFLGGGYNYATWLGPIDAVVVLVGVGVAFYFKTLQARQVRAGGSPDQRRPLNSQPKHCGPSPPRAGVTAHSR